MKYKLIFTAVFWTAAAFALPLNALQIDRNANWVLHADIDTFKTTALSTFLRQKSAEAGLENKMDLFKSRFSFHPIEDVHGVTIYGFDANRDRAVALIHAEFKVEKMVLLLPEARTATYGRHTLYTWDNTIQAKKTAEYGAVWGNNLIVMAGTMASVQKALDVLDGACENASMGSYMSAYIAEPGQFFYVRSDRVADIAKNDPNNMMLKQVEQFLMTAGEMNGRFQSRVDMGFLTQEKVVEMEQIIRGLIAFGLIDAQQNDPELTLMLKAVQIQPNPGSLSLLMDYKSSDLIDVLTKVAGRREAKEKTVQTASSGPSSSTP